MWKRIPFFPSWAANVEVEIGLCELELPLPKFYEKNMESLDLWLGRDEEYIVEARILCHGNPAHKVSVSSRCPLAYDESRVAVVWSELLRFPVKVRELTIDATLAIRVLGENGVCLASTSVALFDRRGALKQGLVKALIQEQTVVDSTEENEAKKESKTVMTIRGDEEYEQSFAATDYLFQADKLRDILIDQRRRQLELSSEQQLKKMTSSTAASRPRAVANTRSGQDAWSSMSSAETTTRGYQRKTGKNGLSESRGQQRIQWLDELSLHRAEYVRAVLGARREWLRSIYSSTTERNMLGKAFLLLELARFDHPVLFEEKAYAGAPVLAPLVTPATEDEGSRALPIKGASGSAAIEAKVKRAASRSPRLLSDKEALAVTAESPGFADRGPSTSSAIRVGSNSAAAAQIVALADDKASVDSEEDFVDEAPVYDYEDNVVSNPIEDKYRALARDATRALVDRELKPDVDEARALACIIGSPSDELAPLDRELVWKFRFTLTANPHALPKFLVSVDWQAEAEVAQVRQLLAEWRRKGAIDIAHALKLLGPEKAFQHDVVRSFAVDALRQASDQELIAYLLQLVQALRYSGAISADDLPAAAAAAATASPGSLTANSHQETVAPDGSVVAAKKKIKRRGSRRAREIKSHDVLAHETANVLDEGFDPSGTTAEIESGSDDENESPLAAFLSERACVSLAVANFVWWYLKVGADDTSDEAACYAYRVFRARFVQTLADEAPEFYATLKAQEQVVASILSAQARAREVKGRKDHKQERLRVLLADLRFPDMVRDHGVPAPLDPTVLVRGLATGPKTQPKMYRSAMYPALVALERLPDEVANTAVSAQGKFSNAASSSVSAGANPVQATSEQRPLVVDRLFAGLRRSTGGSSEDQEQIGHNDTAKTEGQSQRGSSYFLDGVVGSITTAAFGADSPHRSSSVDDGIQTDAIAAADGSLDNASTTMPTAQAASEPATHTTPPKATMQSRIKPYRVIVKNGDDLRQDQLVLQFVLLMDLLLKRVNLDLKLTCFRALATGPTSGLIEFVEDAMPISAILAEYHGSIINFLKAHNPDSSAKDGVAPKARDNFTRSAAGYCVITYLLGVGDRHLDNIMVRKDGRMFHIDFGFILGRDPKPYPPPFRLTKEMAEAMGYPDDANFNQTFKSRCCQAYITLRKHAPLLLHLMELMKDAGIEHLSETGLQVFQDRFRLDLSDEDAERFFLALISESLNALVPVVLERFHKIAVWMK